MATLTTHGGHGETVPELGSEHISHPPLRTYFIVYVALLVLLGMTVGAYYIDLNKVAHVNFLNILVALVIAVAKATLVILYFMNVKGGTRLTWLWAGIGFIWLLLMGGVFLDYQSRTWLQPHGWQ